LNLLFIGDVVGQPGRRIIAERLPALRQALAVDFCAANAENAAGGSGLTLETAMELLAAGVDVLTNGDHVWQQKEIIPLMVKDERLLRPANISPLAAGRGWGVYAAGGAKVGVLNLQGRTFMKPVDCPFRTADAALPQILSQTPIVLVDFHAEATAEKVALGWHLAGRVSAVLGTHTHVQTADEEILSGGTAYITDVGMTGPYDSVIGRRKDRVIEALLTSMPKAFDVAKGDARLCGALVTVDAATGRASAIRRLQVRETDPPA
jgi:metallophosphoesterase (TIGR00282 family)